MKWYFEAFKKYAVFAGRVGRREFWLFTAFNVLFFVIVGLISGNVGGELAFEISAGIYAAAVLVPTFAATVRRLHDTDRSAGWIALVLVPFAGPLVLAVLIGGELGGGGDLALVEVPYLRLRWKRSTTPFVLGA